jgi:hypothetical protein
MTEMIDLNTAIAEAPKAGLLALACAHFDATFSQHLRGQLGKEASDDRRSVADEIISAAAKLKYLITARPQLATSLPPDIVAALSAVGALL